MLSLAAKYGVRLFAIASLCSLLGACAGSAPQPSAEPDARRTASKPATTQNRTRAPGAVPQAHKPAPTAGRRAADIAVRQVGVPYLYGGSDPQGFDCSGLVHYAYRNAGKSLPRTTGGLWQGLDVVGDADMQVGDILFFRIEGKMSHVGLYLGDGRFVHAPSSGRHVGLADLNSTFYRKAFIRAGRPR